MQEIVKKVDHSDNIDIIHTGKTFQIYACLYVFIYCIHVV